MTRMGKSKVAAAAALVAGTVLTSAAMAEPLSPSTAAGVAQAPANNIQQVREWRRGGWRGHGWGHRHGGWDNGWGWGVAGLATGLALSSPYWGDDEGYGPDTYAYDEGGPSRCAATFRSFDPRSGTYVGYDGVRRACPYL